MNLEKYNEIVSGKLEKISWEDYTEVSIATLPILAESYGLEKPMPILDKVHCILGIVSETSELINAIENNDKINIGEEIADKFWYISALSFLEGVTFDLNNKSSFGQYDLETILKSDSNLIDLIKKELAYRKINDAEILFEVTNQIEALKVLMVIHDIDLEVILANNIRKLYARYKGKFDNHLANNRNLENERKELGKNM